FLTSFTHAGWVSQPTSKTNSRTASSGSAVGMVFITVPCTVSGIPPPNAQGEKSRITSGIDPSPPEYHDRVNNQAEKTAWKRQQRKPTHHSHCVKFPTYVPAKHNTWVRTTLIHLAAVMGRNPARNENGYQREKHPEHNGSVTRGNLHRPLH